MAETFKTSRRDFLKTTAAGAVAIAASPSIAGSGKSRAAWDSPRPINPNIDNLRVVFAHDQSMINTSYADFNNFGSMNVQNGYVDSNKIKENLDKMAIALADKGDANEAWNTIFMKPQSKSWDEVTVAMKVNGIGVNHPRLAVVSKVCEELIRIGVSASNINIYDSCHWSEGHYGGYVGNQLPAGVVVNDGDKKKASSTPVPLPNGSTFPCTSVLVEENGGQLTYTKDILINFAVCKNHSYNYGNFTMTLKNHIGSLKFSCPYDPDDLPNINRSEAILGDFSDTSTPARQQLCIIDALWSSKTGGPSATPNVDTSILVMGTSSPIVDYLTGKAVRENIVENTPNYDLLEKIIQDFGHDLSDLNNLDMIDALDYQVGISNDSVLGENGKPKSLTLAVKSSHFKSTKVHFNLPGDNFISSLTVYDMKGKMVRSLMASANGKKHREIIFDGKDNSGNYLAAGSYIINLVSGDYKKANKISLIK